MRTAPKIRVEVPEKLLEKAQHASGAGITETVRLVVSKTRLGMVEAGGVEPPSEKRYEPKTTCLAQFSFFRPLRSE